MNCIKRPFDEKLVNGAMPIIKHSCNVLIIMSALVCILSLKWHKFSDYLSYLMVIFQVVFSQVPSDKYDRTESLIVYFLAFIGFVWFYTGHGMQIVFTAIGLVALMFFPHTLIYKESFTFARVFEALFMALAYLLLTSFIAIMIRYIS